MEYGEKNMVKITDQKGQLRITLPKTLSTLLGWKAGDELAAVTDQYQKDMILKKV